MKFHDNILIVDDDIQILKSLKRFFINEPYGVFTANNSEEGFGLIKEHDIKVVMADQRMPEMTGVQFLQKVKDRSPEAIRILFTGYSDYQAIQDAINMAHVHSFVNKPWNEDDLKVTIRQALNFFELTRKNKVLVQRLEEKNKRLFEMYQKQKEFNSVVSHELRTPLASIKMSVEIVLGETAGKLNDDQKNFLNKTKSNVDRLNRLVNDILDLNKLESSKMILDISSNDIVVTIKDVIEAQKRVAEKKGLNLVFHQNDIIPEINFDKDKIVQVLDNLISNAIKFTYKGRITTTIWINSMDHSVVTCIEDTGTGIKPEDKPKLFQKFQQLAQTQQGESGTGLGLAIVKEIIEQHGGCVWVESEYGRGSKFYFSLPAYKEVKP